MELVQWYQLRCFTTLSNIFGVLYAVCALSALGYGLMRPDRLRGPKKDR